MAINNQPTIEPRTITGIFTKYIAKVIPLAFDESMSYYECICALLNFMNETVVPAVNNNGEAVEELQQFYLDLQNYVNNYFDSQDWQEMINNKLDEMVEDGTLSNLLSSYFPFVSPEMFGAAGDGETDDTTALTQMFASNNTNIQFGSNKTYLVSENFIITDKNNVVVNGNNSTLKMEDGTEENELENEPSLLQFVSSDNITINNLILDVNGDWMMRPHIDWGGVSTYERTEWQYKRIRTYGGLRLTSCNKVNINNVKSQNSRTGFLFQHSTNINLTNSISYKTFADGIFISGDSSYINVENHYCELCGDDCYSTYGFEETQPKYINFSNCNAYNCGGGLLCANSSLYVTYNNITGTEIGYNPYKIESQNNVCENIKLENCNATTVNVPELEEEYAFVLGKRQTSENYTSNVLIKNSSFIYPGASTRRIELRHQGIHNLKYVNCTYKGITPLFYLNTLNVELNSNNFETQDAITFENVTPLYLKRNIVDNKNNFNVRGYNGFTLTSCSNVIIEENKITNETTESSHSFKALTSLSNVTTDDFDFNALTTTITGLKSNIPITNTTFFPCCVDNQPAIKNHVIGTIVSGTFTDDISDTLTGFGLTCKVYRKGRTITAVITGNSNDDQPASQANYMFTLPASYRPAYSFNEIVLTASGKRWLLGCQTDGRFGLQWAYDAIPSNTQYYATVSWVV